MKTTFISPPAGVTPAMLKEALAASGFTPTTVISTGSQGADALALDWALACKLPVISMPPRWDVDGRSAGYKRNTQVAQATECVIAFWDGTTRYVGHLISEALRFGKQVYIQRV